MDTTHARLSGITLVCCFLLLAAVVATASPVIIYPAHQDLDRNRIDDRLDARIALVQAAGQAGTPVPVTVLMYAPPTDEDHRLFNRLEGKVRHRFQYATYGLAGTIPARSIAGLAQALGEKLCIIEEDLPGRAHLDDSMRQARARWLVWAPDSGYGLQGNSDITVAIFDSGIDTTHTDLSGGRLVFWHDFTTEGKSQSVDVNGHGSHVAGIVGGSGAVYGSGTVTTITTTMEGRLPATAGNGYVDMIKVPVLGGAQITSTMRWWGSGTGRIELRYSNGDYISGSSSSSQPLSKSWSISSADIYKAFSGNSSGLGSKPFSTQSTYPYTEVGDDFNLFQGMARYCSFAGVKILEYDGTGNSSDWSAAFDSIAAVNSLYNIKVANASVGLFDGGTNTLLHSAANGLVSAGTVLCISAGNDYSAYKIGDPGLAEKAITVGAINDYSAMTKYSSNGPSSSEKPDVVAGGGSHSWDYDIGSEITSVDTNDSDGTSTMFGDQNADDYCNMFGTSMASPVVAGLAALIIQAQEETNGYPWGYSESQALGVKMIIQMTATETNKNGEISCGNNPALNRGGKDRVEGYGKVNADAAIEAVTEWFELSDFPTGTTDTTLSMTFGNGDHDRKCWARQVGLCGPDSIIFHLDVPATADYDLYLYSPYYSGDGEPVIVRSSTGAGSGVNERFGIVIGYMCSQHYVVAKRVSGYGEAELRIRIKTISSAAEDFVPAALEIDQNYPNPFGVAGTTIPYYIPGTGRHYVSMKIYDASGALVRTILRDRIDPGSRSAFWDGRNDAGRPVASGVYFVRLEVAGQVQTRTINLVR